VVSAFQKRLIQIRAQPDELLHRINHIVVPASLVVDLRHEDEHFAFAGHAKLEGKLSKTAVLIGGNESGTVKSLLSLREGIEKLIGQGSEGSPGIAKSATPPPTPTKSLSKAEFPMKKDKSLEGIISSLTKNHG
jgi:hypothetical protein